VISVENHVLVLDALQTIGYLFLTKDTHWLDAHDDVRQIKDINNERCDVPQLGYKAVNLPFNNCFSKGPY